jgi:hypothetical protein
MISFEYKLCGSCITYVETNKDLEVLIQNFIFIGL